MLPPDIHYKSARELRARVLRAKVLPPEQRLVARMMQ
jgi:hypothetical protein